MIRFGKLMGRRQDRVPGNPKRNNGGLENQKSIGLDVVASVNDIYLEYVRGLSREEIKSRIREVLVSGMTPGNLVKAREILDKFGIVVIADAIDVETCRIIQKRIESFRESHLSSEKSWYEDEKVLVQHGPVRLKGYHQMSSYGKAVANIRQGQDLGMVDIFNADFVFPEELAAVRNLFEQENMLSLLGGGEPQNLNVYINRGIMKTRGFHVDSYTPQVKAFVYLTDVETLDDGPYTFVKMSHQDGVFRRANQALGEGLSVSTETLILDPEAITPVLAPMGSLIISDQSGFHRGWPQDSSGNRMLAVMKYSRPGHGKEI